MGKPKLELGRRFARIEQNIRDLQATLAAAINLDRDLSDNLKYQMEMSRVEDRLKKVEDQLEELLEAMT